MLAIIPKCALCVLAYASLGAALGSGGPEMCGPVESSSPWPVFLGALAAAGFLLHRLIARPAFVRP
jgi:hypothetical protein